MSATITYKGSILTTVNNTTKTLTTKGTWLEDDIIITDTSTSGGGGGIIIEDTPDSHGGTIRTITAVDLSDTTAIASDVAQGKYFYGANGIKTVGTNTDADEIADSNEALGNDGTASLSEAITALTTYANETTGASDTTLSDAVETLADGYNASTPEVTINTSGAVSQSLQPDIIYHFTSSSLTSLTITFAGLATDQYHFDFISSTTAATLSLPASVIMPTSFGVEANSKYEIDIVNNYGVYAVWVYEEVSS